MSTPWYQDDMFWNAMNTALFDPERLAGTPDEVDSVMELVGMVPGMAVLDLCCGPGRHSLELARRGFVVTGVDRTHAYLRRARRKARRQGLPVNFVERDMREPCGDAEFDVAINMFTSFGYFEDPADDRRVAANLLQALKPGGVLLMDTMGKEIVARRWQARDWAELPDGGVLLQERTLEQSWSWIRNRWLLVHDGNVESYEIGHRLYAGSELAALFAAAGFGPVRVLGSLEGAPYDHASQRLIIVAHKPE